MVFYRNNMQIIYQLKPSEMSLMVLKHLYCTSVCAKPNFSQIVICINKASQNSLSGPQKVVYVQKSNKNYEMKVLQTHLDRVFLNYLVGLIEK